MTSKDLFSFHIRKYNEDGFLFGRRRLGPNRWAFDIGKFALIFEFWYRREASYAAGTLSYVSKRKERT